MSVRLQLSLTALSLFASFSMSLAHAAQAEFFEVPTNWKLENYVDTGVTAWNTAATCNSGHVIFPVNTPVEHQDRFFALVLAAKISNRPIFVRYENLNCNILSFGIQSP